jgi:hypothetical protein
MVLLLLAVGARERAVLSDKKLQRAKELSERAVL